MTKKIVLINLLIALAITIIFIIILGETNYQLFDPYIINCFPESSICMQEYVGNNTYKYIAVATFISAFILTYLVEFIFKKNKKEK